MQQLTKWTGGNFAWRCGTRDTTRGREQHARSATFVTILMAVTSSFTSNTLIQEARVPSPRSGNLRDVSLPLELTSHINCLLRLSLKFPRIFSKQLPCYDSAVFEIRNLIHCSIRIFRFSKHFNIGKHLAKYSVSFTFPMFPLWKFGGL
jgi:hypothetical protein